MSDETIIKKEKLFLRLSAFSKPYGNLVLTSKSLTFFTIKGFLQKTEEKTLEIPISSILNVQAVKAYSNGTEHMHITYKKDGKEIKTTIEHVSIASAFAMGNASRLETMYFADWVSAIEGLRNGKKSGTIYEELEKLAELKGKGIITQEEFDAKKKKLLAI